MNVKTQPNFDRFTRTALAQVMEVTARLMAMGYSTLTFESIQAVLFRELTFAMRADGLSQKAIATLIGETIRTFYNKQKRAIVQARQTPDDTQQIRWRMLMYLAERRRTRYEVLTEFAEVDEEKVTALLEVLRNERLVFETGGRGGDEEYFAPKAELPYGDPDTLEAALTAHISSVGKTLVATLQKVQSQTDNGAAGYTYSIEVPAGGDLAQRARAIVDRFRDESEKLWAEVQNRKAEGSLSPCNERVSFYAGRSIDILDGEARG
ncbi:MAG: hypothetical protein HUU55_23055 [Myxococcales bacterium]|nr:hypothetical protein [Myxococcales bacterium]